MLARVTRAILSNRFTPIVKSTIQDRTSVHQHPHVYAKAPPRFYLFPSLYRSFFSSYGSSIGHYQSNLASLMPFRQALDELKRRLFFAAPAGSRLLLGLLGYSLLPQSSFEGIHQIGALLFQNLNVDSANGDHDKYSRATLEDFELGQLLGYGCNAAVYEARLRSTSDRLTSDGSSRDGDQSESDLEVLPRQSSSSSSSFEYVDENFTDEERLNELTLQEVRYRASTNMRESSESESQILPAGKFNLAIKMLFNYGIQSNAEAIEKAMEKELLPLRKCSSHPNIVHMYSCFVDQFPLLHEAYDYYPMAIPSSLSPEGYGRNKTLFIVMRRYDMTLSEYLRLNKPSAHERLLLFAQLLEALLYLKKHSIVHRDLKSDNLLISSSTGELVLADFGCALYQPPSLKVPYPTDEIGKGGNLALMAPEIVLCKPGIKSVLDYSKADLWASGTLCYEFYSQPNPFFHGTYRQETYTDQQLPPLSPLAPPIVEKLAHAVLRKNPKERPSIALLADCVHLCLWFPLHSLKRSKNDFYQAYMWTALETLFTKRSLSSVEFRLKKFFFQRQCSQTLYHAQSYINQLLV